MTEDEFNKIKDFAIRFARKVLLKNPGFKVSIVKFGPTGRPGEFWFQFIDLDTGKMTEFFYANINHDNDPRVDDAFAEYNKGKSEKDQLNKNVFYNPSKDLQDIYGEQFPKVLDETDAINKVKDGALEKQEAGSVLYEEFTIHTPKAPAEASATALEFTPVRKAKTKKPTLKAQTSFEIGQGLRFVQQTKPFIFPDYVACDNGSDATAVNQIIDGYNAVSEEELEGYIQVAPGFYAPLRPAKIPLAQMYELQSHATKDEELTTGDPTTGDPAAFFRTGMICLITSPGKNPFIIVIRGFQRELGSKKVPVYTSQTDFFEGDWYSGENTLNPNIKEVAMGTHLPDMGTHLPNVFKDSKGKQIVMNSIMRYSFKFVADLLLSIEKAFATHDALAGYFLSKKIEYKIDPTTCEISDVPIPDNTTLFLTRGSVKNKNTESKKKKGRSDDEMVDDYRFDAVDKFFSNNNLRNKIKSLPKKIQTTLLTKDKLNDKTLKEVIILLNSLGITLDDNDIDTLNDIMSEDSSGEQKIYLANFEAFFYNTDSSVTRIGIILNRVLDKDQINHMRQEEELKEFERKRAVLLQEEEYLKESVTSAINESIDFISRVNDIYSYRQRKTYYEKKIKGISDMLESLVDDGSLLEKEKKETINSILDSISANSNLVEQNAFCKDALDLLETFSKEISEEGVTFADSLPPFSSSSSSSSSSSVDTESEKYKSSIRRIIRRVLESKQELIGEVNVKSELEKISNLINQKETLDKTKHAVYFNKIYELIEPTLTELNKVIEGLTAQLNRASPNSKVVLGKLLSSALRKEEKLGGVGFYTQESQGSQGSQPYTPFLAGVKTPFSERVNPYSFGYTPNSQGQTEGKSPERPGAPWESVKAADLMEGVNEERLPVQTPGAPWGESAKAAEDSMDVKTDEERPPERPGAPWESAKAALKPSSQLQIMQWNKEAALAKLAAAKAAVKEKEEQKLSQKQLLDLKALEQASRPSPLTHQGLFSPPPQTWNHAEAQQQLAEAAQQQQQAALLNTPPRKPTWNQKAAQQLAAAAAAEQEETRGQKRPLPPVKPPVKKVSKGNGNKPGGSRRLLHRKKNKTRKITRNKTRKAKKMRGLRKTRRRM